MKPNPTDLLTTWMCCTHRLINGRWVVVPQERLAKQINTYHWTGAKR